ncbi:MAG TPA: hypothetical protein VFI65_26000 [Streptosporangiaceae bacterium]|nr:hypothetical protein [Streptosporangiaceae bacterium]
MAAPSGEAPSEVKQAPGVSVPPPRQPSVDEAVPTTSSPPATTPSATPSPIKVTARLLALSGRVLRAHPVAAVLLTAGLVLRVLAWMAYHPALLYTDTLKYLYGAWPGADPVGYTVILKPILFVGDLGTVAFIQHVLGLAMAVGIYALLVRRGVPRWLAALAMAPILLDAYQLQIEQTIMPDVWFEAFVVAGLVLLLWRPEPSLWLVGSAGLIFGASATIRQIGLALVMPALLYLAAATTTRRLATRGALLLLVTFSLPVLIYSGIAKSQTGHFNLSDEGSIAGRITAVVDCATIVLPADERPLCPTPSQQANGIDWLEHSRQSPEKNFPVPNGVSRYALISGFDSAVEQQQPMRIIGGILRDSLHLFALTKTDVRGVTPIYRWQFQKSYPHFLPEINVGRNHQIILGVQVKTTNPFRFVPLNPAYGGRAQVDHSIASFLRSYQRGGGYTPGPLLAVFAVAALIGAVLAFAGRRLGRPGPEGAGAEISGLGMACLLIFTEAVGVLLISDMFEFSWRYQLPALVMLPPAGVLGGWALWRVIAARRKVAVVPASEPVTATTVTAPAPA